MGVPGYTRVGAHLVGGGSPQGGMGREHVVLGRLWEQRRGREEQLESGDSERAGLGGESVEVRFAKVMVMVEEVSPIGKNRLSGPWLPWSGLDRSRGSTQCLPPFSSGGD